MRQIQRTSKMMLSWSWTRRLAICTGWFTRDMSTLRGEWRGYTKSSWQLGTATVRGHCATNKRCSRWGSVTSRKLQGSKPSVRDARKSTFQKLAIWTWTAHVSAQASLMCFCSSTLTLWYCHQKCTTTSPRSLASISTAREGPSTSSQLRARSNIPKNPFNRRRKKRET